MVLKPAALAGLAPYNRDGGRQKGTRRPRDGRPGTLCLYMAALTDRGATISSCGAYSAGNRALQPSISAGSGVEAPEGRRSVVARGQTQTRR
jgi:hypothetical protein